MRQLAPLIVRRAGPLAAPIEFDVQGPLPEQQSRLLDDLKLFVLGWLGGLVFFGTYFS